MSKHFIILLPWWAPQMGAQLISVDVNIHTDSAAGGSVILKQQYGT